MAHTVSAKIRAARLTVDFRRDGGEDWGHLVPRFPRAPGHDARSFESALLASGDPCAQEVDPLFRERFCPPDRVLVIGVAAVDDDVARLQERQELVDDSVHRRSRLHHHHDLAGPRERLHEVAEAVGGNDLFSLGPLGCKLLSPLGRAIVHRDGVPLAFHVEHQVLPHHC